MLGEGGRQLEAAHRATATFVRVAAGVSDFFAQVNASGRLLSLTSVNNDDRRLFATGAFYSGGKKRTINGSKLAFNLQPADIGWRIELAYPGAPYVVIRNSIGELLYTVNKTRGDGCYNVAGWVNRGTEAQVQAKACWIVEGTGESASHRAQITIRSAYLDGPDAAWLVCRRGANPQAPADVVVCRRGNAQLGRYQRVWRLGAE